MDGGTDILMSDGEHDIRQSIWIILATAPGERVMRPDFAAGIHNLAFSINDVATVGEIARTRCATCAHSLGAAASTCLADTASRGQTSELR